MNYLKTGIVVIGLTGILVAVLDDLKKPQSPENSYITSRVEAASLGA